MIGQVIGNYRIASELGKGGMGVVYRAEHIQLGRPAALKMLLPQLSNDPEIVQRFFNEARAASAIDHPGIVEVYDYGRHTDGRAYIVMALLNGESLEHRLRRGGLAPIEGASIVTQVVGALAAAHGRGIVHRDLKPDNIFLVPNELVAGGIQIKLLDFGIAKLAVSEEGSDIKTQTGVMMGTPAYMSPEQCMGKSDLDHRSDLYSIGCILFHVLCGRTPFTSEYGAGVMIAAHLRDPAPDPRTIDPQIPQALAAIVLRLLEKDPAARYQTSAELRVALVAAGAHAPSTVPPRSLAPVGSRLAMVDTASATIASLVESPRYTGPEAFDATTAPTTGSGTAAQVFTPAAPSPTRSRRLGVWIAGGTLVVLGGVVAFVAVSRTADDTTVVAHAAPVAAQLLDADVALAIAPTMIAKAPPAIVDSASGSDVIVESASASDMIGDGDSGSALVACAAGQVRHDDTDGHCCWPEQAWSSSRQRCVGTPRCPAGTTARREQCVAVALEAPRTGAFALDAARYAPGAAITIRFPAKRSSPPNSRAWVAVSTVGKPPSSYDTWKFVDDGALTASLVAPTTAGAYEVRLYTEYPVKPTNLAYAVPFTLIVPEAPSQTPLANQRFAVASSTVAHDSPVAVRFPVALTAVPSERFWITIVAPTAADSTWGHYDYVPAGARTMTLTAPATSGEYEIRLHANYPTKSTNVVYRVALTVE